MSVVALDDKSVEVLRDTKQQWSATVNTNLKKTQCWFHLPTVVLQFPTMKGHAQDSQEKNSKKLIKKEFFWERQNKKKDINATKLCITKNVIVQNSLRNCDTLHLMLPSATTWQYWKAELSLLNVCHFLGWLFTENCQKTFNNQPKNKCSSVANFHTKTLNWHPPNYATRTQMLLFVPDVEIYTCINDSDINALGNQWKSKLNLSNISLLHILLSSSSFPYSSLSVLWLWHKRASLELQR